MAGESPSRMNTRFLANLQFAICNLQFAILLSKQSWTLPFALGVLVTLGGSVTHGGEPLQPIGQRGAIIVVEGVGGIGLVRIAAQWALPRAGVSHEIIEFNWTHGRGKIFRDLQDTEQRKDPITE